MSDGATVTQVKIWDLPIRIVHWCFVMLLPMLWWSAEQHDMDWHKRFGLILLGLVTFRLLWGFLGSSTARFAQFVKGPKAMVTYLAGKNGATVLGHNPLGALSVVALLAALFGQIGLGLIAQDVDGIESGPLSFLVSYDTADWAREGHEVLFNILLALIAVHLLAILYYGIVKRDNLVKPMVTGRKSVSAVVDHPIIAPPARAIVCAAIAAGVAYWVSIGVPLPF